MSWICYRYPSSVLRCKFSLLKHLQTDTVDGKLRILGNAFLWTVLFAYLIFSWGLATYLQDTLFI